MDAYGQRLIVMGLELHFRLQFLANHQRRISRSGCSEWSDMDLEVKELAEKIRRLQRCINGLTSLLAVHAVWRGSEPFQVIKILLDAGLPMLG